MGPINRLATFLELPEYQYRGDGPVPPGSIRIKDADVFANQVTKGGSFLDCCSLIYNRILKNIKWNQITIEF